MERVSASFVAGVLFGGGLTVSQMVNPTKVTDFLDFFGRWDPSLAFVMGSALAVAFVDSRAIMHRLDTVFGIAGWQDSYQLVAGGSVVCTLSVRIDGEWISKTDVGSPSEQPDPGDKLKAAFADSLKRAAVKIGIGRYLYRLTSQWVDYDPQTKQLKQTPTLPAWALPPRNGAAPAAITNGATK